MIKKCLLCVVLKHTHIHLAKGFASLGLKMNATKTEFLGMKGAGHDSLRRLLQQLHSMLQ
jgi:hypothetical protein